MRAGGLPRLLNNGMTLRLLDMQKDGETLSTLLNVAFARSDYLVDYPSFFDGSPNNVLLGIFDRARALRSHVGIRFTQQRLKGASYLAGNIGAVATDPQYRGHGLAAIALEAAVEEARRRNAAFVILWSDRPDYYARFGFVAAGIETSLPLPIPVYAAPPPGLRREASSVLDLPKRLALVREIGPLYNAHHVGTQRSEEDFANLLRIPHMEVFTCGKQAIEAYAICGKGADMLDHLHEWGGNEDLLLKLFAYIVHVRQKAIRVLFPGYADAFIRRCEIQFASTGERAPIGLIHPLAMRQVLGASPFPSESGGKSEIELLQKLFGGSDAAGALPFYWWGLDSV